MAERTGAVVIQFPRRGQARTGAEADPLAAQERMARALSALETALAEQRAAVAGLQSALSELSDATARLDRGLRGFSTGLDGLAQGVQGVGRKARDLEAWADGVLGHTFRLTAAPLRHAGPTDPGSPAHRDAAEPREGPDVRRWGYS